MFKYIDTDTPRSIPRHFKGVLTDLQQSLLFCMKEMEMCPNVVRSGCSIRTQTAMVVEKLSIGKSYVMSALSADCLPPVREAHHYVSTRNDMLEGIIYQVDMIQLPCTVIVSDTVGQITDFMKSADMIIHHVSSSKDVAQLDIASIQSGTPVTPQHVVLVKHGMVKGPDGKRVSILKELRTRLEGYKIARLIIDNFDALRLTSGDKSITADFTWLVCSRVRNCINTFRLNTGYKISEFLYQEASDLSLAQLSKDEYLRTYFTIRFDRKYVEKSIRMPMITEECFIIEDPIEAQDITNIEDLYYSLIKDSCKALDELSGAKSTLSEFQIESNKKMVARKLKGLLDISTRQRSYSEIETLACTELSKRLQKLLRPITRLVDNLSEDGCQCCMIPFEDCHTKVTVFHCCQAIICKDCNDTMTNLIKCPRCMTLLESRYASIIAFNDIRRLDTDEFIDSFKTVSFTKLDPLLDAIINLLKGYLPTMSKGRHSSYMKDFVSMGQCNRVPKKERWVIFCPRVLQYKVLREVLLYDQDVEVLSSVRRITSPAEVTHLVLVGNLTTSDRRRVINDLYNRSERVFNLKVFRLY